MTDVSFSAIVATCGRPESLRVTLGCLRTAIREAGGGHEVIVVDNHSSDGTGVYLCEIIDRTAFDIGGNFSVTTTWSDVSPTPPTPPIQYGE